MHCGSGWLETSLEDLSQDDLVVVKQTNRAVTAAVSLALVRNHQPSRCCHLCLAEPYRSPCVPQVYNYLIDKHLNDLK